MIPPNDLSNLLDEMTGGIRKHASLCAVLLPRVAPEGSIVAMFAEGLLSENRSRAVHIEWGKKDLVLYDGERSFWFEFKCLWSNGYSECAGGIMKDYDKLLESVRFQPSELSLPLPIRSSRRRRGTKFAKRKIRWINFPKG